MKILLIGGERGILHNDFFPKLEDLGIEVGWHWDWDISSTGKTFPTSCDGVVIIKNMVSHSLSNKVWSTVKKRNLPCAWVSSKFSLALPALKEAGLVKGDTPRTVTKSTQMSRLTIAIDYAARARAEDGRVPSLAEMQGVIQRAFGPRENLNKKLYRRALNEAACLQPLVTPEPEQTEDEDTCMNDVQEMATLVLGEYPELLLEPPLFQQRVEEELERELSSEDLEVLPEVIAQFHKLCQRQDRESQGKIRKSKQSWLRRYLSQAIADGNPLPAITDTRKVARSIFTTSINDVDHTDIRAEFRVKKKTPSIPVSVPVSTDSNVGGKSLTTSAAYDYYLTLVDDSVVPLKRHAFRYHIYSGACVGKQNNAGHWSTTPDAVQDFAKKWHEEPTLGDSEEQVTPEEVVSLVEVPEPTPVTVVAPPVVEEAPVSVDETDYFINGFMDEGITDPPVTLNQMSDMLYHFGEQLRSDLQLQQERSYKHFLRDLSNVLSNAFEGQLETIQQKVVPQLQESMNEQGLVTVEQVQEIIRMQLAAATEFTTQFLMDRMGEMMKTSSQQIVESQQEITVSEQPNTQEVEEDLPIRELLEKGYSVHIYK